MKKINDYIRESQQSTYYVEFQGCQDKTGVPITITCLVDKDDAKEFEKFLKEGEGDTILHADGGNLEF